MGRRIAFVLALVLVLGSYPVWLGYQIWEQARRDETRRADAIVVLGAAQYDGRPSPVFRARLDHAAHLYHDGFSDTIVVTGGRLPGDRFTEAEAGRMYLVERKVPENAILGETSGRTTLQSLRGVRSIARRNGIDSLLLVSDPLHSERVKRMAHGLGFHDAYVSWASYLELERSRSAKVKQLVREIGSLMVYELFER